ncbi:MAG: RES domain-containing protein [Hafnia sp.]
MSENKRICTICLSEPYLCLEIEKMNERDEPCDYCGGDTPNISMGELASYCDGMINNYYESSGYDFHGDPVGTPLDEVLRDELGLEDKPLEDLISSIETEWFCYDSHEKMYGDDPHFKPIQRTSGQLDYEWGKMKQSLQHYARFFNPEAMFMLDKIFNSLQTYRTKKNKSVIIEIPPDVQTFYRARVFQSFSDLENALFHPERHLGPPSPEIAQAGRMNAKGISVFYGSTVKENAINEVRPPVGSLVATAEFKLTRKVRLLDITEFENVVPSDGSHFDPEVYADYSRCEFLRTLTRKLVMPVMPEMQDRDYLVTQAVADYLASSTFNLDGILFPSVQSSTESQDNGTRNVILFTKSSHVKNANVALSEGDRDVYMDSYSDEPYCFRPEIITNNEKSKNLFDNSSEWPSRVNTLEIDLESIEVHNITSVSFAKSSTQVMHKFLKS